jgi:hypothetical protein
MSGQCWRLENSLSTGCERNQRVIALASGAASMGAALARFALLLGNSFHPAGAITGSVGLM